MKKIMSDQKSYSGSLELTKLKNVVREMPGKDGKKKKVIIIPVEDNHLVEGKDNRFYMPIRVLSRAEQDDYGQNGFISQSVDSKVYKQASDEQREEFKKMPILGNIKDFSSGGGESNTVTESENTDLSDDLPF